jgi:hypothetical protein
LLADQPAAGLPFLLLGAVTVYLVYLALAVLPLALSSGTSPARPPGGAVP